MRIPFPIICLGLIVLFSPYHDRIMMVKPCFKGKDMKLIWLKRFKSCFSLALDGKKILGYNQYCLLSQLSCVNSSLSFCNSTTTALR